MTRAFWTISATFLLSLLAVPGYGNESLLMADGTCRDCTYCKEQCDLAAQKDKKKTKEEKSDCSSESSALEKAERNLSTANANHKAIWKEYEDIAVKKIGGMKQIAFLKDAKPRDEAKLKALQQADAMLKIDLDAAEKKAKSIGGRGWAEAQKDRDNADEKYRDCIKALVKKAA
jgi:hypothetical protein